MLHTIGRAGIGLAVLIWGLTAGSLQAQDFPRTLQDIKVYSSKNLEVVQFEFSKSFDGVPGQEHRRGLLALNFMGIGSKEPVRNFRISDSRLLKEIKLVQNRYSTTVTFTLRDKKGSLKNRLVFTHDGNLLRMAIQPRALALATAPAGGVSDQELLRQMEQVIAGRESQVTAQAAPAIGETSTEQDPEPLGSFRGISWMSTLVPMVLALAAITGALYGLVYLYGRFFAGRRIGAASGHSIKLVASHHIGPKQRVVVIEINGEQLACGVTPNQITFLARLGGSARVKPSASGADNPGSGGGSQMDTDSGADTAETATGQADAVQHFAEVLKRKVRSLKQIK